MLRAAWAWKEPIAAVHGQRHLVCCRIDDLAPEFLEASHGIWLKALAYLVLDRRERALWRQMDAAVPKRRQEWLLGRCAAKDAVRMLLRRSPKVAHLRSSKVTQTKNTISRSARGLSSDSIRAARRTRH